MNDPAPQPSPAPKPNDLEPDPASAAARRPLFGPWFWLMILLAGLCIGGGAVVGFYGHRLFPG